MLGLFWLLLLSTPAFADGYNDLAPPPATKADCGENKNFSAKLSPPFNQGNAAFCYSFTTSDVMSEAIGQPANDPISPFAVGAQYISLSDKETEAANRRIHFEVASTMVGEKTTPSMGGMGMGQFLLDPAALQKINWHGPDNYGKALLAREGGYPDLIMGHLLEKGFVCRESEVPSQAMLLRGENATPENFFSRLKKDDDPLSLTEDGDHFFTNRLIELSGAKRIQGDYNALVKSYEPVIDSTTCLSLPAPGRSALDLLPELHRSIQDWAALKVRNETEAQCHHPVKIPANLELHSKSYDATFGFTGPNFEAARKDFREILDRERPIALSYDSCVLQPCREGEKQHHASVVVGKEWNDEKSRCELILKNSWGVECPPDTEDARCRKGYWYVSMDKLIAKGIRTSWIEK